MYVKDIGFDPTKVLKEDFDNFVRVRDMGVCNMLSEDARFLSCINKEQHQSIINHFDEYKQHYYGNKE